MERTLILRTLGLPSTGVKTKQLIGRIVAETGWKRPGKYDKRDFFLRYLKRLKDSGLEIKWGNYGVKRVINYTNGATKRDFYSSPSWIALRYQILKKHGGRCHCCGATAASSGKSMHVDHIKPRSIYPDLALEPSNLQVLCYDCNIGKSNIDETDWRQVA
jgi:hypothetical protein